MRLIRAFTAVLCVAALAACEKNAVQDLTGPLPEAGVRFFNWALNSPSVHFYGADRKLSASLEASCSGAANPPVTALDSLCVTQGQQSASGISFGGVSSGRRYTGIDAGEHTFTARVTDPARADYDVAISSVTAQIQPGRYYSVFQSGSYNATARTADAFIVEDDFPQEIDWTVATIRFVNAVHNAPALTFYAKNVETNVEYEIGTAIPYKSAGAFVEIPPGAYDLRARAVGATTDAYTRANVAFSAGRVNTIATRGDYTSTSTTATNRRFLDNTQHW